MATSSSSNLSPKSPASSSATDPETLRRSRTLSSKLCFHVPSSRVPLFYSTSYDTAFLGIEKLHPFDSSKWRHICQFLTTEGVLDKSQIVEPLEASQDDLLVVPPLALLPNCLVEQKALHPFQKWVRFLKRIF